MTSPLLALFLRSLREDARGRATYGARGGLGILVLPALYQSTFTSGWVGAPGLSFLSAIATLQMLAITLIGLSYFASAMSEEKEGETLGLLRMSGLNPLSILLGIGTSRLCGALLLLAAQIPFTIFAITLGGVSYRQIAAVYGMLAAYTFLLGNLGLLGSVLARRAAGATAFCLAALAALLTAGPFFSLLQDSLPGWNAWGSGFGGAATAFREATPFARLDEVLGAGFRDTLFGWQVVSNLALGTGCFLLAWAVFERFCDRTGGDANAEAPAWGGLFGRPSRAWKAALVWKDFHFLCGGRIGFALRILAYGGAVILLGLANFELWRVGLWVSFAFVLDFGFLAGRVFRAELNQRTLSSLAILPCGMRKIARAKACACLVAAAPGAITTIVFQTYALCIPAAAFGSPVTESALLAVIFFAFWLTLFVLVHVVARYSLRLRYGSLPLGILMTGVGGGLAFAASMILFGTWAAIIKDVIVPAILASALIVWAVVLIGRRVHTIIPIELERMAGQE